MATQVYSEACSNTVSQNRNPTWQPHRAEDARRFMLREKVVNFPLKCFLCTSRKASRLTALWISPLRHFRQMHIFYPKKPHFDLKSDISCDGETTFKRINVRSPRRPLPRSALLCAELFGNFCHWSLKGGIRHNRHPIKQEGNGGVQEGQLAGPRSTEGLTDNQHGGRRTSGDMQRREETHAALCIKKMEEGGWGREKRWSLPKWVVMPHLSIPCCHSPSPTPEEF